MRANHATHHRLGRGLAFERDGSRRVAYVSESGELVETDDLRWWRLTSPVRARASSEWLDTNGHPEALRDAAGRSWTLVGVVGPRDLPIYRCSTPGTPWGVAVSSLDVLDPHAIAPAEIETIIDPSDDRWTRRPDGLFERPFEADDHVCHARHSRSELEILAGPLSSP